MIYRWVVRKLHPDRAMWEDVSYHFLHKSAHYSAIAQWDDDFVKEGGKYFIVPEWGWGRKE